VGLGLLEAKCDEGEDGVVELLVGLVQGVLRAAGFPGARRTDLVLQLDDNAFGGLPANAGYLRERLHVAVGDGAAQGGDVHSTEHIEGELRPDATDGVDEQPEHIALGGGHETIQHVGIFAHGEVREQMHVVPGRRQFVERGKRDERFVAHAMDLDGDLRGQGINEFAAKKSDHRATHREYEQGRGPRGSGFAESRPLPRGTRK